MILDVYKDGEVVESIELSASKRLYNVGRQVGVADIVLSHGSISRDHATLTVSASGTVVVMDMGSAQGTRLSGKLLPPRKAHALPPGRSLMFGQSSRIYKLREGGSGFVSGAPVAPAAPPPAAVGPRVQALQVVLQQGAPDLYARPRPDGFFPASAVVQCAAVAGAGCTEAELPAVLAQSKEVIEAVTDGGEMLLRAKEGHAQSLCVDTARRFRQPAQLPALLVHGARFKDWNSIRSKGLAGSSGGPIWLCAQPPAKGTLLPSLGGKVEVLVFVDSASLSGAGVEVYEAMAATGEGEALEASVETLASTGDESGVIGAWHIEKALNARDGSELMTPEEAVPLREARTRELAARAQKVAAAAAAKAEKARVRALEEERRIALEAAAQPRVEAAPRYNPYLAHHEEGITAVKKANNRTAAGPTTVRKRGRDDDDDEEED